MVGKGGVMKLFVVCCTRDKVWDVDKEVKGKVKIEDVYVGEGWRMWRGWEVEESVKWVVLSGKYGIVEKGEEVEWYDVMIGGEGSVSVERVVEQVMEKGLKEGVDEVRVLGGGLYVEYLKEAFKGVEVRQDPGYAATYRKGVWKK